MLTSIVIIVIGVITFLSALYDQYFVNETEGPATEEEKLKYKATPVRRLLFLVLGLGILLYGIWHLLSENAP